MIETFMDFVNKKYRYDAYKYFGCKKFKKWDDYALWLYYINCKRKTDVYYSKLEDDIKQFSDLQTQNVKEDYTGFYKKDKLPNRWFNDKKD